VRSVRFIRTLVGGFRNWRPEVVRTSETELSGFDSARSDRSLACTTIRWDRPGPAAIETFTVRSRPPRSSPCTGSTWTWRYWG